jgi:F-type H+-transporting ATPase subunit delta
VRHAAIGRVYASALLELAVEREQLAAVVADLRDLDELWATSPEFRRLLESPELSNEQKRKALERLLAEAASPLTLRFLFTLLRRHRESLLPTIMAMFRRLLDVRENRLRGELLSARPLDEGTLGRIESALSSATGSTVELKTGTDDQLLAGMVLHLADRTVDGSLRTRLGRLRDRLLTAELGKE